MEQPLDIDKSISELLQQAIINKYGRVVNIFPWQENSFQFDHVSVDIMDGVIWCTVNTNIELCPRIAINRNPLPYIHDPDFDVGCVETLFKVFDFVHDIFKHISYPSSQWISEGIKNIIYPTTYAQVAVHQWVQEYQNAPVNIRSADMAHSPKGMPKGFNSWPNNKSAQDLATIID
jgi:hypothetical protein